MPDAHKQRFVGRAARIDPPNRFIATRVEIDGQQPLDEEHEIPQQRGIATQFLPDRSQSIIARNSSPDIPFDVSINPYRGCEHGCAYCYARPTHEYLGFGAGLDFESKIMVKFDAAELLRKALADRKWQVSPVAISGVTDCYQPAERKFRITRGLLEVFLEARHPVVLITKNALVLRDLDLLRPLAEHGLVKVAISVTTLDAELARVMEPRTSPPSKRLEAVSALAAAGVPTSVMVAPVIPGLTDHEMPAILKPAREAGAASAAYVLLRLPLSVEPVFRDWLSANFPDRRERIESLIRGTRSGELSDSQFGRRMRGQGPYAEQIDRTFRVFVRRYGLDHKQPKLDCTQFRPPNLSGQMHLF